MDSTYHATPAEHVVHGWAERVPATFTFALKLPQALTPEARPPDDAGLRLFCDRAQVLDDRLGPVLVQLGPEFGPEGWGAVATFVERLPAGIRWAIEFRHRDWVNARLLELLRRHQVALALVAGGSLGGGRDRMMDLAIHPTADFAYVRWIGTGKGSAERELAAWAVTLAALAARVTAVYGYFSNHFQGHAPASVREMQRLIGLTPVEPDKLQAQTRLL